MKKMAIILALLLATSAFAQGISFGVKGGVNYTSLSGDDVPDGLGWKLGFGGGVVAALNVMDMFVIQPEVLYTMKGGEDPDEEYSFDLTYVEVPVLLKYSVPMEGMISPNFFVGPSLGILMSAEFAEEDVKDDLKTMDFGVVVGAGVDFDMGTGKVTLDGRYTLGLMSIDDSGEEQDWKNGAISVMLGYMFGM
jgi:hypothetical protein